MNSNLDMQSKYWKVYTSDRSILYLSSMISDLQPDEKQLRELLLSMNGTERNERIASAQNFIDDYMKTEWFKIEDQEIKRRAIKELFKCKAIVRIAGELP